jgi:hypothetical protein
MTQNSHTIFFIFTQTTFNPLGTRLDEFINRILLIYTMAQQTASVFFSYANTWLCCWHEKCLRFQVLTAASTEMTVFWTVAPCSLVEVYRRLRGACGLHNQGDDHSSLIALMMEATSTSETSVNVYQTTQRNSPEDGHLHENYLSYLRPRRKNSVRSISKTGQRQFSSVTHNATVNCVAHSRLLLDQGCQPFRQAATLKDIMCYEGWCIQISLP